MSSTMEPFENLSNLFEDVGMFEAAVHAPRLQLPPVDASSILLALDGSNQDEPASQLAKCCGEILSVSVHERRGLTSAGGIREVLRETGAKLLVLPAPFGRDIEELREASLGDVVDLLLLEAGVPILVVRQPLGEESLRAATRRILVPVTPGEPANALALAWACRFLGSDGQLHVLEVADREVVAEALRLMGQSEGGESAGAAAIQRSMQQHFASLIGVVQRAATEKGFSTNVLTLAGRFVAKTMEAVGTDPTLLIIAGSRDHQSPAYHRASDLILSSKGPVLVV